jgi:peptidoglycan/LPS O-acetylase OafA/YrhL
LGKDQSADGLRGLAALNVFFAHALLAFFPLGFIHFFPGVAQPAAQGGRIEQFLSIPVLSILWNGRFPVCIFFVLSGYVLTKSFVERGDVDGIRSKAARRPFRLGIPVFFSVILAYALMAMGWYHSAETVKLTHSAWLDSQAHVPVDFWVALREGVYGSLISDQHSFNPALWTMRMEFIGSMMIFAYRLIAWRGIRGLFAAAIYLALVVLLAPTLWPFYLAFLLGSHIGEWPRPSRRVIAWGAAICGILLASVDSSPMFAWLNALPLEFETRAELYSVLGGALLVYGVRGGAFSRLLTCRPVQFLGRVSYPLYLVHLPLVFSMGCGVFNWLTLSHGASRLQAAGISMVATLATVIFVAWLFEILIDAPAIRFSKAIVPSRAVGNSASPVSSG